MKWHEEALDGRGRRAAGRLAPAAPGFYLAGGTGLALRLGHRISLDLDLFSPHNALGNAERIEIIKTLGPGGRFKVKESKNGTLHLSLEETSISLLHYPYPLLRPTASWRGLAVASEEDISAMKLGAVAGRGSRRDFIDLYFLCRRKGLDHVLDLGVRKFQYHADFILQSARALVYFRDAEKEPMPRMLARVSWDSVKSYFEKEIPRLLSKKLKSPP